MIYDFVTNIAGCIPSATLLMHGNLDLVYYSHIPVIIVSLLIGFFVISNNYKMISAKAMFFLSMVFSLWVFSNLVVWLSSNSAMVMFFWSLFGILDFLLFSTSLYLVYTYEINKDLPLKLKLFLASIFLPILVLTPTIYNLKSFDYDNCTANDNLFFKYIFILKGIIALLIFIVSFYRFFKTPKEKRKQIVFISVGTLLFLTSILATGYISDTFQMYTIEVYGIFAMTFFMAFIAYLIVRFKAFDIKLLGAQALVWALIILIGSQLFYFNDLPFTVLIIISATLIISSAIGLMLLRGIKKEIALREQLQVANDGQANLIHIMNHQIKGHLGINKNIFAELLTDDFGKMPEEAIPLLKKGLEESDAGVKYVTTILRGASAESGTLPYDMTHVDIGELLLDLNHREKDLAEEKGLAFDMDIEPGNYETMADRTQLSEAFQNIIDNSIYYTLKGNVWVKLRIRDGKILFSVRDTGVGIRPEDRPKLFKSGGVGKNSMKINVRSSGYGLAFTKGVVEAHKGWIWFESAGDGKGATFFVELPIVV